MPGLPAGGRQRPAALTPAPRTSSRISSATLPLASSSASEADSVVRAKNGQVIVIGGLMRQSGSNDRSQVPGLGNIAGAGVLFGNSNKANQKRELVILLKPTVIEEDSNWTDDLQQTQQRIRQIGASGKERK